MYKPQHSANLLEESPKRTYSNEFYRKQVEEQVIKRISRDRSRQKQYDEQSFFSSTPDVSSGYHSNTLSPPVCDTSDSGNLVVTSVDQPVTDKNAEINSSLPPKRKRKNKVKSNDKAVNQQVAVIDIEPKNTEALQHSRKKRNCLIKKTVSDTENGILIKQKKHPESLNKRHNFNNGILPPELFVRNPVGTDDDTSLESDTESNSYFSTPECLRKQSISSDSEIDFSSTSSAQLTKSPRRKKTKSSFMRGYLENLNQDVSDSTSSTNDSKKIKRFDRIQKNKKCKTNKINRMNADNMNEFSVDYCPLGVNVSCSNEENAAGSNSTDISVTEINAFCESKPIIDEDECNKIDNFDDDIDVVGHQLTNALIIPVECSSTTNDEADYNNEFEQTVQKFEEASSDISFSTDFETYGEFENISVDTRRVLLILHPNTRVVFHGLMTVEVLSGAIDILGYTLKPHKTIEVYSPRGSSFLYFGTNNGFKAAADLNQHITALNLSDSVAEKIDKLLPGSAVILCTRLDSSKISFLEKYIPQQIFPKISGAAVDCNFQNTAGERNVLKTSNYWDKLADKINPGSRTFICGGKSVGKSFLLRYLINKTLMKHKKVLVIDLDPGQSEFTVPGCISATVVEEPVFGPNYTHLREPHKCIFLPDVNMACIPQEYIQSVKCLIESCEDLPDMPVIINFMGFSRGLGYLLLSAVVAYAKPTKLVEIRSLKSARNYKEDLQHSTIVSAAYNLAPEVNSIPFYSLVSIPSMADDNEGWHLEPRQIREMCVLSYFGNYLSNCDNSLSHKNVPVYEINLSKIKLMYKEQVVDPAVMNANLVALCTPYSNEVYTCHGWGIVRAIDLELSVLYLITPLPLEKLEVVDHFILGAVNLPPSIYMTARCCSGLIPYVATGVLDELGAIPKRSHLPRRF